MTILSWCLFWSVINKNSSKRQAHYVEDLDNASLVLMVTLIVGRGYRYWKTRTVVFGDFLHIKQRCEMVLFRLDTLGLKGSLPMKRIQNYGTEDDAHMVYTTLVADKESA